MKVLIIEPNWLGDVLFTTPAIRAIKEKNKDAYISVIAHERCVPILEDNPNINEIISLKTGRGRKGFFEKLKLVSRLKPKNFNTVFLFSRSMSHALICALSGIPERIGYDTLKRHFLLTRRIKPPQAQPHRVEYFLNVIREAGIDTDNKDYEFFIKEEVEEKAKYILADNGVYQGESYFVINPGGNWPPKRWPKEEFAKLTDALFEKYKIKVVITGADKDKRLGEDIKKLCVNKPVNLSGETTLKQLAAILKKAKVVISNDSGPMHISVSQKAPTAALFGPTDPNITGPYGSSRYIVVQREVDCPVPCYSKNCRKHRCMEAITVADALEAVEELLR